MFNSNHPLFSLDQEDTLSSPPVVESSKCYAIPSTCINFTPQDYQQFKTKIATKKNYVSLFKGSVSTLELVFLGLI